MLYLWLKAHKQGANSWNIWDKDALTQAFGKEVADHAEGAFRALWRTTTPVLWVAQRSIGQNEVSERCLYGFSGVSSEAEGKGWADSLSPEEARTAAAYATIELGGFAPFIADLADSHPTAVREVIGRELTGEIGIGGDESYLPTLQSLTNAGSNVKQLINPRLLDELKSWPSVFTDEAGKRWAQHLDNVLYILDETTSETDREAIAQECIKRYEADPVGPVAPCWLKGLFRFDAPKGTQVLTEALAASDDPSVRALAVEIFATLFGQHNAIVVELEDPAQYAQVIGQLVRLIYAVVRRTDDQIHDGVFSPDARDHAERARNSLLSRLLDTPGRAARRVVLELAAEDDFVNIRDRLRLLARQRTAADAEFAPFSPKDVVTLEDRYGAPPQDRDGLFAVMMDRLDDLAIDLADGDFTDRRTVQRINEESEMQRTLARRLKENTNGAYLVTREEEVADQKRTDIRLLAVTGDQKAVVEVKLADKWSLAALDQALQEQLVGRYLRDANCKAGCLLLTYRGEKNYWIHPNTRDRLSFAEAVAYLQDKARILENESPSNVRIAAFGLDLTGSGSRP